MGQMVVREAARTLGVSPQRVRALIGAGRLTAVRVGRDWAVDVDSVVTFRQTQGLGRPMVARTAWGLALAVDGRHQDLLAPHALVRARARLSRPGVTVDTVRRWFERRHEQVVRFSIDAGRAAAVLGRPEVVPTGVSLADVLDGDDIEVCVDRQTLDGLVGRWDLPAYVVGRPSLVVHVVDSHLTAGVPEAPRLVAACDLADSVDRRTRLAGRAALAAVLDEVCS